MLERKAYSSAAVPFRGREICAAALSILTLAIVARASNIPARVAILDLGDSSTGRRAGGTIEEMFASPDIRKIIRIVDREQTGAAAKGIGYDGSLNLTIEQARDLGSAIGCDFYFLGNAQTVKRSPSNGPSYFESFASVFLISARTGRLVFWERPAIKRDSPEDAEKALISILSARETCSRYISAITRVAQQERAERTSLVEVKTPFILSMADDQAEENKDVRAPRPYRRLKPAYPESAARAEVEATVDGLVEIERWAGYGLDQSVIETVKQMHFFPAMRNGVAIPMRVLLRYNFRKPPIQNSSS